MRIFGFGNLARSASCGVGIERKISRTMRKRIGIVLRVMIGDAGNAAMNVGAAKFFRRDFLAGCRFHQRRAAEKDRALISNDDGFVAHRRNVSAAGRARSHHRGDLIDPGARHPCLVVKNAAEVIAIRKDLGLQRQKCAAGIDQVQARQVDSAARFPARADAS